MNSLKQILQALLKTVPEYENQARSLEIADAWPRIVGDRIAKHTKPVRLFDDGVLLIHTDSSAWLHQMQYLESHLLERIEKEWNGKRVQKFKVKLQAKL